MKNIEPTALMDLRHLVALRALAPQLPAAQRATIDAMAAELERRIGPTVPKRRAAAVLDISTQALDDWIRRGRLEAQRRPDSTRTGVATASLVWTANQIPAGAARPGRFVDRALERAAFWRLNAEATAEQARLFVALPFARRVAHLDALNQTMATLGAVQLRPSHVEAVARGT